jgi:S-adenosylmethionine:tRNA ribosyltransferase-isomerase
MNEKDLNNLTAKTQIIIAPGYQFKIVNGLITNFHQPQSTLLLLVGAFIGKNWKEVYDYALKNNFRFLSYGDGNLLWRNT